MTDFGWGPNAKLLTNKYQIYPHTGHVGQKRLEGALTSFRDLMSEQQIQSTEVDVEWKPYIIDPGTNIDGEGFEAYCSRRWGSSGWTHHLRSEGRKDGASFDNWKWWPSTLKSHCMVKFAKERYGVETSRSNAAIFNALYEDGKNISLIDVLLQIGEDDLGLPRTELQDYLAGEGEGEVQREINAGRRKFKISGVPFFVIEKEGGDEPPYGLSGAQNKDTFLSVFKELSEN